MDEPSALAKVGISIGISTCRHLYFTYKYIVYGSNYLCSFRLCVNGPYLLRFILNPHSLGLYVYGGLSNINLLQVRVDVLYGLGWRYAWETNCRANSAIFESRCGREWYNAWSGSRVLFNMLLAHTILLVVFFCWWFYSVMLLSSYGFNIVAYSFSTNKVLSRNSCVTSAVPAQWNIHSTCNNKR